MKNFISVVTGLLLSLHASADPCGVELTACRKACTGSGNSMVCSVYWGWENTSNQTYSVIQNTFTPGSAPALTSISTFPGNSAQPAAYLQTGVGNSGSSTTYTWQVKVNPGGDIISLSIKKAGNLPWCANALPVTWVSVDAVPEGKDGVIVNWSTASEQNNDAFFVEASTDGKDFIAQGSISGAGDSTEQKNYSYRVGSLIAGKTYYFRVRQVDFDGKSDYSEIVSATIAKDAEFAIFPNPSIQGTAVSLELDETFKAMNSVKVEILRSNGTLIQIDTISPQHQSIQKLSLGEGLSPGTYFVRVSDPENARQSKMKKFTIIP